MKFLMLWLAAMSLLAGSTDPQIVAWGDDLNLVVTDTDRRAICRVTPLGEVTVLALFTGEEDPVPGKPRLEFEEICGLVAAPKGSWYVIGDSAVWMLEAKGEVRLLAGTPEGDPGDGVRDGCCQWARFDDVQPDGYAGGPDGALYLLEEDRLRQVTPQGQVRTRCLLPTEWKAAAPGVPGREPHWASLAVDGAGDYFVTDDLLGLVLRVRQDGSVVELPACPLSPGKWLITSGGTGQLVVADPVTKRLARFTPEVGWQTLIAKNPGSIAGQRWLEDGFEWTGLRLDRQGHLLLAGRRHTGDGGFAVVRIAASDLTATTPDTPAPQRSLPGGWVWRGRRSEALARQLPSPLAGLPPGVMWRKPVGLSPGEGLELPGSGLAVDDRGTVFVAEPASRSVVRISAQGEVATWPGVLGGGAAAGIAVSPTGSLFLGGEGEAAFRELTAGGALLTADSTWMELSNLAYAGHGPAGTWLFTDGESLLLRVRSDGQVTQRLELKAFPPDAKTTPGENPRQPPSPKVRAALAGDDQGNVYSVNPSQHCVTRLAADGQETLFAGEVANPGSQDGPAGEARFSSPGGLVVDRGGAVIVADSGNHTLRRIDPEGTVTTLAGTAGQAGFVDATGYEARFDTPTALALGPGEVLYVLDQGGAAVRRVSSAGQVTTLMRGGLPDPGKAMEQLCQRLEKALDEFCSKTGNYPADLLTSEPLSLFLTRNDDRIDIWGTALRLRTEPESGSSTLESAGPDRQFGTADDLVRKLK